jgi:hypothetical protein
VGLQLPDWLTEPLSWIGLDWPQADEEKLFEAGQAWIDFSTQLSPAAAHANSAATNVWSTNDGPASDAFKTWWNDDNGPNRRLADDMVAAMVIGGALILFAAITLALKIMFIVQLIILAVQVAVAIAAAIPSLGASTATIPAFIAATRLVCAKLIHRVVDDIIMKSIAKLLTKAKALLRKVARRAGRRTGPPAIDRLAAAVNRNVDTSAISPNPVWRADNRPLYRNDDRPMSEIFENGFGPRNTARTDLTRYVEMNESSAFVGTSYDDEIDMMRDYTYEIDAPGGVDVNQSMVNKNAPEQEVAFPGGVDRRFIKGGWEVEGGVKVGDYVPNPHYDGGG